MPTMYPTLLPETVVRDGAREAERRVYDALGFHKHARGAPKRRACVAEARRAKARRLTGRAASHPITHEAVLRREVRPDQGSGPRA
jgi:hypothetical protein